MGGRPAALHPWYARDQRSSIEYELPRAHHNLALDILFSQVFALSQDTGKDLACTHNRSGMPRSASDIVQNSA